MEKMTKIMQRFEEKPYNMCLNCAQLGKKCDGPNFLAMDIARLCEWCRLRKEYLRTLDPKWTNAYVAEQAGMSKISIDRFLSGNVTDLKTTSIARILQVLVNGSSWGQYLCAMDTSVQESDAVDVTALEEKVKNITAECEQLKARIEDMKAAERQKLDYLAERSEFHEKQLHKKDELLAERADYLRLKDRAIRWLSVALAFVSLLAISELIMIILTA